MVSITVLRFAIGFLIWEAIRNDFVLLSVDENMELYKKEGFKVIV